MNLVNDLTHKQAVILSHYNKHEPHHLIMEGAVRSGKTHLNNLLWIMHVALLPPPSKSVILTGTTIGSLERNVLTPLEELTGRKITLNNFNEFRMGRHKVCCFGTNQETSYRAMQGMTSFGWYANEIVNSHPSSIIEAFNRCSGEGSRIFWDSNPDHPYHNVKINFIDKSGLRNEQGQLLIQSFHFQLEDNETLSPEYIEQVKRNTPAGMWYDRRIKGLWVAAEGIIYEAFDRNKHVCEPFQIPADWQRVRGIDFGTVHPFVMLWGAIDPDGRLFIYREYYKTNTLIKSHAETIKRLSGHIDESGKKTSGETYLWTVSDHDLQERIEYDALDIPTAPANKAVKMGLDLVAQRMVDQIDDRPRLQIFKTCTELTRQIGIYRWLPYEEGKPYREEPLKVDDDGPDVLRYIVMGLDFSSAPKIESGFRGYNPDRR